MRALLRGLFDPPPGGRRHLRYIGIVGPIGRVAMMTRTGRLFHVLRPGAGPAVHQVVNGGDNVFNGDDQVVIPV